jgi:hypothetical protein
MSVENSKVSQWELADGYNRRTNEKYITDHYDSIMDRIKNPTNADKLADLELLSLKELVEVQMRDRTPFIKGPADLKSPKERSMWEEYKLKILAKPSSQKPKKESKRKVTAPTLLDFLSIVASHVRINFLIVESSGKSTKEVIGYHCMCT